jgi:hypothetical protein
MALKAKKAGAAAKAKKATSAVGPKKKAANGKIPEGFSSLTGGAGVRVHRRVVMAKDVLSPRERRRFDAAIRSRINFTQPQQGRVEKLNDHESLYLYKFSEHLRLVFRKAPGGVVEVLDVVQPGTLKRYATAKPTAKRLSGNKLA